MRFIIIGLGNFGASLGQTLIAHGHEVIGVDRSMELVDKYKHELTHTVAMDTTSKESVKQLPLRGLDAAIVGIGENEGASIITTALLKRVGVLRIICRVTSSIQKVVLQQMEITEFIEPEAASAERLAERLITPGVFESFVIDENYKIYEVAVPSRYIGKTVQQLNLTGRYKLVLITIMKFVEGNMQVTGIIPATTELTAGAVLVLFGTTENLKSFIEG